MIGQQQPFWHSSLEELLKQLESSTAGLAEKHANARLNKGKNSLFSERKGKTLIALFFSQFKSPLILLLLGAALLSLALSASTDAIILFVIVFTSGILSFFQEKGAMKAMQKLHALVRIHASVFREGRAYEVPIEEVVPGDIVLLNAGDVVPGDSRIIMAHDCFVNEAALTGETMYAEKVAGTMPLETPLARRSNVLFMGTHVVSGTVKAVVVHIGNNTEFGKISERLKLRSPQTAFESGARHFGYMLMEVTLILVIAIFAFNLYLHRPLLESFLFALALAVGLTPQLLPAIISVTLSHGAKRMAKEGVIVKRLASIENFGSIDILCSDKTGTLTTGAMQLDGSFDIEGHHSDSVLLYAYINASFHTGYKNPIDDAILHKNELDSSQWIKLDEIPYDFVRKKMSVLVENHQETLVITKGAVQNILDVCTQVRYPAGKVGPITEVRDSLNKQFSRYSQEGYRVLGLSYKVVNKKLITWNDEAEMVFIGFLLFFDPPKAGVAEIIKQLRETGVRLKIITGDHHFCAGHIAEQIGFVVPEIVTGSQLRQMSDLALIKKVQVVDIFAEVEPNQKERIILALRQAGCIVGYIGDGINDASALHHADVGISVDTAVDVAKESSDIVLLKKDLRVLLQGIEEGRKTFANTLKYIFMATSANFGNMFSMAAVSVVIPFLPLLPKQILLMNLLTDLPEMMIATDRVDLETLKKPVQWDLKFIKRFMMVFGWISSIFDIITFIVLLFVMKAPQAQFRTGWFLESVASAALIALVIRTRKPFFQSRPSFFLIVAVCGAMLFAMILPYTPLAALFGFEPVPFVFYFVIGAILGCYVLTVELAKKFFYAYEKKHAKRRNYKKTWRAI